MEFKKDPTQEVPVVEGQVVFAIRALADSGVASSGHRPACACWAKTARRVAQHGLRIDREVTVANEDDLIVVPNAHRREQPSTTASRHPTTDPTRTGPLRRSSASWTTPHLTWHYACFWLWATALGCTSRSDRLSQTP
jgi:hypothetical protein